MGGVGVIAGYLSYSRDGFGIGLIRKTFCLLHVGMSLSGQLI